MPLKNFKILLLIFLISYVGLSQSKELKDSINSTPNAYVHFYKNRLITRIYYVNTSNSLTVNHENSGKSLDFNANKQSRIGASIAFRKLAISYSYAPEFISTNKNNQSSKLFNLNLRGFYKRRWMQTIKVYNEKGFYAKNGGQSIYLPNTESFKIGGSTSYIFNDNFSYRALASQNERQLKNAGSFIPGVTYYYSNYHLDTEGKLDENNLKQKFNSYDLLFSPSYFYNYIPNKNLLISAGTTLGLGLNYSTSENNNITTLVTELGFSGTVTYDLTNLYIGSHFNYLILKHNTNRSLYVKDDVPYFQFFVGYRFRASKKLVKTAEDFNEKITPIIPNI
ncbi:DUF4421 domain-containing protein [Formosa sp. 3Alg 14/1]|uniref:DUF4421 domain-containing protein n=1 Tax=Formosa sp. 3Alg 14/1 TaxID=3382190 RepID=UPI0039BE62D8